MGSVAMKVRRGGTVKKSRTSLQRSLRDGGRTRNARNQWMSPDNPYAIIPIYESDFCGMC